MFFNSKNIHFHISNNLINILVFHDLLHIYKIYPSLSKLSTIYLVQKFQKLIFFQLQFFPLEYIFYTCSQKLKCNFDFLVLSKNTSVIPHCLQNPSSYNMQFKTSTKLSFLRSPSNVVSHLPIHTAQYLMILAHNTLIFNYAFLSAQNPLKYFCPFTYPS